MIPDELIDPDPPVFGSEFRRSVASRARARRRRRWQLTSGAVVAVSLVAAALGALAGDRLDQLGRVQRIEVAGTQRTPSGQPRTLLLIGSDAREDIDNVTADGAPDARTDTMLLVRVDPAGPRVRILPLPRDLWVGPIDAGHRLNSAFSSGGVSAVVSDVETLGYQVDHTVIVTMDAFVQLVDLVNGIDIWFDQPVRDPHTGLEVAEAGCTRLGGTQALALVRSRHLQRLDGSSWLDETTGDLGRLERLQELFVLAVAQLRGEIPSALTVERLVTWASDNLTIDSQLDEAGLLALAHDMLRADPAEIERWDLPVRDRTMPSGAVVLIPGPDFERTASAFSAATSADTGASLPGATAPNIPTSPPTGAGVHVRPCPGG